VISHRQIYRGTSTSTCPNHPEVRNLWLILFSVRTTIGDQPFEKGFLFVS
jgi:hypothetical protein